MLSFEPSKWGKMAGCGLREILGEIDYERAYYRCAACRRSYYAGDAELGITETSYTLPAQEAASLVCGSLPFAEGGWPRQPSANAL